MEKKRLNTNAMRSGMLVTFLISLVYFLYFVIPGTQLNAFTTTPYNATFATIDLLLAIAYLPLTLIVSPLVARSHFKSKYGTSQGSTQYFYGCAVVAVTVAVLALAFLLLAALAAGAMSDA